MIRSSSHMSRMSNPGSTARRTGAALCILAAAGLSTLPLPGGPPGSERSAAVITIHEEINDVLRRSIERRVEQARAEGAQTIIFELNTPGGLVTSALDISKLIKRLQDDNVRTIAWVRNEAYSAGALIAVACQQIYMTSTSSIGDCAPIMLDPTGGVKEIGATERAKAESPILEEFRESASRNGYDPLLCRAMVAVGEEVWWIERIGSEERRFVRDSQKKSLLDDVDAEKREWRLVEEYADPVTGKPRSTEQPIDRPDTLLTMSQSEAVAFGFARGVANDEAALRSALGLDAALARLEISGWEQFALWLNSPIVRGILFVLILVGGYIEFQSPGLVLPGVVALVALGIFLGAPYAAGLADIWTLVLLVIGILLLGVEIFVLPGFGIAGVGGILLILLGALGTFVPREPGAPPLSLPNLQGTWDALKTGVIVLSSSMFVSLFGIILLARFLPSTWIGRRLILPNPEGGAAVLALPDPYGSTALVGDVGVVTADLRPAGQARFGQSIVEVRSQGEYVGAGTRVQVLEHQGMTIVVRPVA